MSPGAEKAVTAGQRFAAMVRRAGGSAARWAATQSWGRLLVLAILALIAQHIITEHVFHWNDVPRRVHQKIADHVAGAAGHKTRKADSGNDEDAELTIGPSGITVRSVHRDRDAAKDAGSGSGAKDSGKGTAATGAATPDTSASPPEPAAAGTPGAPGAVPAVPADAPATAHPADTATHPEAGSSADASADADTDTDGELDPTIETPRRRTLAGWANDITEGLVMLLIVYLLASKVVLRQTAKSEARAAQAEASAAEAAADAEREALKRQLAEAELQTLQAQVEPHFLFNTLASVDYLIETDPARASAMQKNLIQYLRAALPQMRTQSSQLGREGDLSRAYLEILKVRMEDRLQPAVDIPEGLRSAEFPPMMLLSLVENAIQHGVEPKPEGGEVRVSARVADGQLEVAVADSGVGLPPGGQSATAGSGLGLSNLRERLTRLYGAQASFTLEPRESGGTVATIRLPYRVSGTGAGARPA